MKLIKQSFEILEQKDFTLKGIKQFIEKCARVSYKSEDKMTDTSYEKFVGMLESRDHSRPLEFGTVHLKMEFENFQAFEEVLKYDKIYNSIWIKYNEVEDEDENWFYVTTNYRYYIEMCKHIVWLPTCFDEEDSPRYPKRYTTHMILSRGVMDEFRTHIGLSHLAESTRYCNYSKDKFNNELTFIIPNWTNIKEGHYDEKQYADDNYYTDYSPEYSLIIHLFTAEATYLKLLQEGWKPQQAREVLPLAVKSELISCGFADAWENFFYRRDAKDAHPMAQEIAKLMHKEFIERGLIDK